MKRKKKIRVLGVVVLGIIFLLLLGIRSEKEKHQPMIGVIMWEGKSELCRSIAVYAEQLEEILDIDLQILSMTETGSNSYTEIARKFCRSGGDILINVETEDLHEIMKICEESGVYLLQMWESTNDTDILYRLYGNQYFLGSIVSNEEEAGRKMAEAIVNAGCATNAVMTFQQGNSKSMVHHLRREAFCEGLDPIVPISVLEISRFDEGIKYLAKLDDKIDGLLLGSGVAEYSLETIKLMLGNPEMKFTYFDMEKDTRKELDNGDLVMVSCGQQNVFILAVTYAAAFMENEKKDVEKLNIICPYLNVTSAEEYDIYQEKCIQQMPYSADQIRKLKESLKNNTDLLKEYADSYSISWLKQQ